MAMNFLMSQGGAAAINGASGLISSILGNKSNSAQKAAQIQFQNQLALQREAQEYNTYAYQHRYQWEKADKEAAGLNQLYGLSSPSSPTVSAGSAALPEMVSEGNNKRQMAMQGIQLGQSASALYYDNMLKSAETKNKALQGNLMISETINSQLEALYKKRELDYYDKIKVKELEKMDAEIKQDLTGSIKNSAEAGSAQAMTNKIKIETKGQEEMNKKLKALGRLYSNNPEVAAMILGMQETGGGDISKIIGLLEGIASEGTTKNRGNVNAKKYQMNVKGLIKANEIERKRTRRLF